MDVRPRPDARDDAELVRAATAGDRGAFAAIYDRYADRLHDFCWSVLRDRDEAADATQDAFLVAAERLGQLRDPERLRPWLYAIARSQALRRVRARSRVAPEEDMTDLPDTATGPEQSAHQADLRKLASPLALLAAVPPMPAPAYLRGRVLERVQLTAGSGSGGEGSGSEGSEGGGSGGEGSGAPRPQSRMAGPPEGESSRRADSGVSGIHSPLLGAGAGAGAGGGKGPRGQGGARGGP